MRYAIVSDLHSNKPALKSVLADIASNSIDEIICLGDVVGYGPNPAEVLEIAYSKIHHFVLGNHDAVIAGKLSYENFNDNAKRLIDWTHKSLDGKAVKFFNSLPLEAAGGNFRCAHGEFANPGRFGYILEIDEAIDSFDACKDQVMFAGHSHVPGLFVVGKSGIPHWIDPVDFGIEDEKRYIVNVGSVGQPRDDGIRSSYCIFDTEKRDVLFRKVAFDIDEYIDCQKRSRSPESPTYFIDIYHDKAPRPIREIIDFHRISAEKSVTSDVETTNLQHVVAKLRKTRLFLIVLLSISAIALSIFAFSYYSQKSVTEKANVEAQKARQNLSEVKKLQKTIYGNVNSSLESKLPKGEYDLVIPRINGAVSETNLARNWIISLTDPEMQSLTVEETENTQSFRLRSRKPVEMSLSYIAVPVNKGTRIAATAYLKSENFESGFIELMMEEQFEDGTKRLLCHNIVDGIKNYGNWKKTSITVPKTEMPKEDGKLIFTIRGQFKGEIFVRKCGLRRVE